MVFYVVGRALELLVLKYKNNMIRFLKKNQNTPRSSEHPPLMGEKMSERLGGVKGCKYKTS